MKICAIVLNYRDAVRTQVCLSSLIGQKLDVVLVVDNSASHHFEVELMAMVERQRELVDYRLHLLNAGTNLGFAGGVNLAIGNLDVLQCEAFLIINNDAVATPGMLARLAIALTETDVLMVAPTVLDTVGAFQPMLWYQRFFGLMTTFPLPGSFPYLSGCCLLVKREMLVEGKLFDEDFFMYGEDTLLGWHFARAGKIPLCLKDAFVSHTGVGSSRRGHFFYEYHMARAHILLAMKTYHHVFEIPLLLISKSCVLCVRAVWRSLKFGNVVPLKAFFMAWRAKDIRVP